MQINILGKRKVWMRFKTAALAAILMLACVFVLPQRVNAATDFPAPVSGDTYTQYSSKYYRVNFGVNMYDYFGRNGNQISVSVNGTSYSNGTGSTTGFALTSDAAGNAWRALIMKTGAFDSAEINTIVISRSGYNDLTIYVKGSDGSLTAPAPKEYTYTLKYDGNGGSGAPAEQTTGPTEEESASFTVSEQEPAREGFEFLGWAEKASDTQAAWHAGDSVTVSKPDSGAEAEKTLYAVWAKADPVPEAAKTVEYNNDGTFTLTLDITGKDKVISETSVTPGQQGSKGTNLVLVIDTSGSIVGKEAELNSAIRSMVNGLPAGSQVGIVLFNETVSQSKIYDASTINSLSFSGVENAATKMAEGISAAANLLNGNGWADTSKDKAMAIISDFDADDYANSINNAKTAKASEIGIYSVKIDSKTVDAPQVTELTTDDRVKSVPAFTSYVSGKYPQAGAENNSMFGMFNQATVTPGNTDTTKTWVYGAAGGNWADIFKEIEGTEDVTETTETKISTKVTSITDTLSKDVELATGSDADVTAELDGQKVTRGIKVTASGKDVSVAFEDGITVPDGKKLEVKIKIKPAASFTDGVKETNGNAAVTYKYDGTEKTKSYTSPKIQVRTATFKVVNGAWNDGETEDVVVTLTGKEGDELKLAADQIPAAGEKPAAGYKAGSWDIEPKAGDVIDGEKTYTYTYAAKEDVTATATFKVVNGSWNDGKSDDVVVTLTGKEGDELKLTADQIPAVGEKPEAGYKAGSWDTEPKADDVIEGEKTYTYTYAAKEDVTATATFKVANGSWNDGKSDDVVVTLTGKEGDELKLAADQIPAAGEKPEAGYKAGSWDIEPKAGDVIDGEKTYTYTYAAKPQDPPVKEDEKIAPPKGKTLTYNGSAQTGVTSGAGYTVTGNVNTNAGTYSATVTPKDGYVWNDGTREAKTVEYTIEPAVLTATYVSETIPWYGKPALKVTVTGFKGSDNASNTKGYNAPRVTALEYSAHKAYALNPSGGKADNYSFKYVSGTLKVKCKDTLILTSRNSGRSLKMKWTRVSGASGYELYMNYCDHGGRKYKPKLIKTLKGEGSLNYTWKNRANKFYKGYVKAYKTVNGKKIYLATSNVTHTHVRPSGAYVNATDIKLNRSNISLKLKKTYTLKGTVSAPKNKKVVYKKHCSLVRYRSSDVHIATVNAKTGKIKAVGKGKCRIYAIAPNGIWKAAGITVN